MNSLSIIVPFIFVGGAGALVLFIVAVIQEGKSERHGGFRQAFFTVVSLVMLTIAVGSTVALLGIGLRQYVFKSANLYQQRYSAPPALYLPSQGGIALPLEKAGGTSSIAAPGSTTPTTYQCTNDCQFTADDKAQVDVWTTNYKQWQKDQSLSLQTRQSLANALGFFIVGVPLFFVFFRLMRKSRQDDSGKPGPLWSLYFYGVAFAGLVMAVVASGIVINDGLQVWLKTGPSNTSFVSPTLPYPGANDYAVKSLLACKDKCGFTSEQVRLANQWVADNTKYQEAQQSNRGQFSSELASAIPFILIGLPLFWYHFTIVRKETVAKTPPATL